MNQLLQNILTIIQSNESLTAVQKDAISKSLKEADKELEITAFKLDRTEKVKRTTAILLEETIEELEHKRKSVELQNRELEIEASLERVRAVAMGMGKPEDMLDLCRIISMQLHSLNFNNIRNIQTAIFYESKGIYLNYEYFPLYDKPVVTEVEYNLQPDVKAFVNQMVQEPEAFFTTSFEGDQLTGWLDYQKKSNQFVDPGLQEAGSLHYYFYSIGPGALGISTYSALSDEYIRVFKRFRNVFELAYRRYQDIEKAEAQAREATIEAALERTRTHSMLMQHSNELDITSRVFHEQLLLLGIDSELSYVWLPDVENDKHLFWATWNEEQNGSNILQSKSATYDLDRAEPYTAECFNAWESGEPVHVYPVAPAELKHYFDTWSGIMGDAKKLKPEFFPEGLDYVESFMKYGCFGIIIRRRLTEDEKKILYRFTVEFERTYTRFLDLKKAEAQSREAQIELGLERVRARAMAMQKSDELAEAAELLYHEFGKLGIKTFTCGYLFINEVKNIQTAWVVLPDGSLLPNFIDFPLRGDHVMDNRYKAWKEKESLHVCEIQGEENREHHRFLSGHVPPFVVEDIFSRIPDRIIFYCANFSSGYLLILSTEFFSAEEEQIVVRFARVFELTYTRFLDLQKAEAQAREAQIETALERVRSRSMGMQKSEELKEVIQVVYEQFVHLNIHIEHTGFIMDYKERDDMNIWLADKHEVPSQVTIPYFDCAHWNSFNEAKEKGTDFFSNHLSFEEKNKFYQDLFKLVPGVPEEALKHYLSSPGLAISTVLLENIGLYIENFSGIPYTDEENNTLMRFGKAFQQTYTRFLDLQKAEAQAREAQIETSLERIRSRAMAMHNSDELGEAAILLYRELQSLGITQFINCGYVLIDEINNTQYAWMTHSDGTIREAHQMPLTGDSVMDIRYESWKRKDPVFHQVVGGEQLKSHLFFVSGKTNTAEGADNVIPQLPDPTVFYCGNFTEGYLHILSNKELSKDSEIILSRFTTVFEITYRRFRDLQKAEAQAREAQIELSLERVRARAMAMQKSDELSELVDTVFKELTKLDFALTWCIINIIDESTMSNTVWAANPDINKAPESYHMLFEDYPFHHAMMKGWKERKTKDVYVLEAQEKKVYDEYLFNETEFRRVPAAAQAASRAMEKYIVTFSFSNFGGLQTVGDVSLSDANLNILSRFGKVFDLTYTRFNDLKQAEAQAREAKIEAALERVRSRALAMHKTDELLDAAELVSKELSALGIESMNVSYAFVDDDEKYASYYSLNPVDGKIPPFPFVFPHTETDVMRSILSSWKKQEPFNLIELDEEATLKHQTWVGGHIQQLITNNNSGTPYSVEAFLAISPKNAVIYTFNFTKGYLFNIGAERLTTMQEEMVMRFTKVFDMTYRRFLDLKQAEAQAREAKIEASLERVRAKTMAMYKSENLSQVAEVVFKELENLNLGLLRCGIGIINKEKRNVDAWLTSVSDEGTTVQVSGTESMDLHPLLQGAYNAWLSNADFSYVLEGEDLVKYYKTSGAGKVRLPDSQLILSADKISIQYYHLAVLEAGGLFAFSANTFPEEAKMVMRRFAAVFNQSYTRFLDLQKAEAQAREAKIEASLERVRSKAMSMQKSEDLAAAITIVFEELDKLDLGMLRCGIGILNEEKRTSEVWTTTIADNNTVVQVSGDESMDIHPLLSGTFDAWLNQENHSYTLKGEDLNNYYTAIAGENFKLPDSQSLVAGTEDVTQYYYNAAWLSGGLFAFRESPFPEEAKMILKRFADVFTLTYTRFSDLKQAEAQAKEAKIEVALERVRSRTLAMQKSEELAETAAVLFQQLIALGIEPNRLYISIVKNDEGDSDFWISDEDGSKVSTAYSANLKDNPTFAKMHAGWKQQLRSLVIDIQGEELQAYFRHLLSLGVPFKGGLTQKRRVQDIAYFSNGFIGIASPDEQPAETLQLLERFAAVFNLTFTRFNDLKIAEAHAIQADEDLIKLQTEKKRAEDALTELRTTQTQLIQSEKMASLGELTAGIAHEIQNPLNFVNNFSEVSNELIDEMMEEVMKGNYAEVKAIADDVKQNLSKINHHGKRADGIVKGMLQHSRSSSGQKEPTNINVLADEYLRLAYHGLRAKDKSFNATLKTDYDESIGNINIIPQDMGRVILNLITNAFYAVAEKKKNTPTDYEPTVTVSTKLLKPPLGGLGVLVAVRDNGNGVPQKLLDKIFQPFFTTKPTGQGTGLGLSLSYDIVKAHGGELKVGTKEGKGTEFIIQLPFI